VTQANTEKYEHPKLAAVFENASPSRLNPT